MSDGDVQLVCKHDQKWSKKLKNDQTCSNQKLKKRSRSVNNDRKKVGNRIATCALIELRQRHSVGHIKPLRPVGGAVFYFKINEAKGCSGVLHTVVTYTHAMGGERDGANY